MLAVIEGLEGGGATSLCDYVVSVPVGNIVVCMFSMIDHVLGYKSQMSWDWSSPPPVALIYGSPLYYTCIISFIPRLSGQ